MKLVLAIAVVGFAAVACGDTDPAVASASTAVRADTAARVLGSVVDSALPPGELLRRFRVGLDTVRRLDSGAARSRGALIERFARAVEARDTAALRSMSLSRGEFAYLYYPSTQYVRRPYELAPDVLWQLMQARSERGLKRLVERVGGGELRAVGHDCEATPVVDGENRQYRECTVRYRRAGADSVETRRLFGSIIERGGRYKFVSYANDF